ncbi:hypothetical protein F4809DRAFT_149463 [Biscogniauxia mediterranea]|nr:hypothetical protein F4809DRAFT_149463 [Biscogniauxia mediterranea]
MRLVGILFVLGARFGAVYLAVNSNPTARHDDSILHSLFTHSSILRILFLSLTYHIIISPSSLLLRKTTCLSLSNYLPIHPSYIR